MARQGMRIAMAMAMGMGMGMEDGVGDVDPVNRTEV
jgi:hypothetical protein